MSRRAVLLALVLLLPATVVVPGSASAETVFLSTAQFPYNRFSGTAFFHDGKAYYLGGSTYSVQTKSVYRYDPATDTLVTTGATLPSGWGYASIAWTGTVAYLFGGDGQSAGMQNSIVRYDPATNSVAVMTAKLPSGRERTMAVWDERSTANCPSGCAYVFGGRAPNPGGGHVMFADVLRYDPASDTLTKMPSALPVPNYHATAVFTGTHAFLFGGQTSGYINLDMVVRYDPLTDTVTKLPSYLPNARWGMTSVWDGSRAVVFGGHYYDEILTYDPATDSVASLVTRLPSGRWGMASARDGSTVYLFGGYEFSRGPLKEILVFDMARPPPPTALGATSGPTAGAVSLAWTAPAASADVTGYRVYRDGVAVGDTGLGTSFVDSGLVAGATYAYRVVSLSAGGESPIGAAAAGRAGGAPDAPRSVATTRGPSAGTVTITWAPPLWTGGMSITGYAVYAGASSGSETYLATVTGTSATETGLPAGATRSYRVAAINAAGEGSRSASVSGKAPEVPSVPTVVTAKTGPGPGEISLSWKAPASNGGIAVTGYKVFRGREAGSETLVATLGNVLAWKDEQRSGQTTYYYRVAAVNGVGTGPPSISTEGSALGVFGLEVRQDPDGSILVYDDANDNDRRESSETAVRIPALP